MNRLRTGVLALTGAAVLWWGFSHTGRCWADSPAAIEGPTEGTPGQSLTFRLVSGGVQLSVDAWQQVLNPDRYVGNDYVTSFTLQLNPQTDGGVIATAPAPGRYKLAAVKGNDRWVTYVRVRPQTVRPEIRGMTFVVDGPLDQEHASRVFALARRGGATWAVLDVDGGIDLESSDLEIGIPCPFCTNTVSLDVLGWLIDEAHRQGLKVAIAAELIAKSSQPPRLPTGIHVQRPGLTIGDFYALIPVDSPLMPRIAENYAGFMLRVADVAQQHGAESLFVGNETAAYDAPLLWGERDRWKAMFAQLRAAFGGQLWVDFVTTHPTVVNSEIWTMVDGIRDPHLHSLLGIAPDFTAGSNTPTAEQMASELSRRLQNWPSIQFASSRGLALIWGEFYPVAIDGMNYNRNFLFREIDRGPRDNQELVDFFEAQMRTVAPAGAGYFIFRANLANNSNGSYLDALVQPAFVNAVANWWGGDTPFFSPCLAPPPLPGLLFEDDFEPRPCPLDRQDSMKRDIAWQVIQDPDRPQNRVLRGSGDQATSPGATIPVIGQLAWTDYTVKLRVRLMPGPQPSGGISVRKDTYSVHLGFNRLSLFKRGTQLASVSVAGGTQVGRWYQLEVSAVGATITVKLDGTQLIQVTDHDSPVLSGGIRLSVGGGAGPATVDFDDISVTTAGGLSLSASVNQTTFAVGQTLITSASVTGPGLAGSADLYLGAVLSDGVTIVFWTGGSDLAVGSLADLRTFRPYAEGVSLTTPFSTSMPNFLSYQWTGGEPRGAYVFFHLATKARALADGVATNDEILGLATAPFSFP